jgi:hypothetical protein
MEQLLSPLGQAKENPPLVHWIIHPPQESLLDSAIHEFYRAVVFEQQPIRYRGDRGRRAIRHAENSKQELILLCTQSDLLRRLLAEVQEAAHLEAELRQSLQLGSSQLLRCAGML